MVRRCFCFSCSLAKRSPERGSGLDNPSARMSFFEIFESEEGLIDQHEILQ